MNFSEAYTIVESAHRGTSFTQRIYIDIHEAATVVQRLRTLSDENNLGWSLEIANLEDLYNNRFAEGYVEGRTDELNGYESRV